MPRNDLQNLTPISRPANTRRRRPPRKALGVGKRFNIDVLNGIINDQTDRSEIVFDVSTLTSGRDGSTVHTLWVGSYHTSSIPYSVIATDFKGEPKRAGAIFRKGQFFDGTQDHGYARVSVEAGDLVSVGVMVSLSPVVVLMRISKFIDSPKEDTKQAVCDVLEVDVFDRSGDERLYTHDVDGIFLSKIDPRRLRDLIDTTRRNAIRRPKWNGHYLTHLSSVPEHARELVNYDTCTQVAHLLTPEQFFDEIRNAVKSFRKGRRKDIREETGLFDHPHPHLFSARTPVRLTYTIRHEESKEGEEGKLLGVELMAEIPFADRLLVIITPENYHEFSTEPFLVLYNDSFKGLLNRVRAQGGEGSVVEERTLRM